MHTKFAGGTEPWGAIDSLEGKEALQRDMIDLNAGNPVILQFTSFYSCPGAILRTNIVMVKTMENIQRRISHAYRD